MRLSRKVTKAIRKGDWPAIIEMLVDAPEKERRGAYPDAREALAGYREAHQQLARTVAIVGTGTTRDIRNAWGTRGVPSEAVDLVLARPKNIRNGIIELGVSHEFSNWLWPLVYELVKRGEIEEPKGEGYVLGVLPSVFNPIWMGAEIVNGWWGGIGPEDVEDRVRREPELVELSLRAIRHDLEGGPLWAAKVWFEVYPKLVQSGHLDRDRMLDICLDGYLSDFRKVMSRHFGLMWAALDPTDDERLARAGKLNQLISTRDTGAQKLGMAEVTRLLKAGAIEDVGATADACRNPLTGDQKNLATAALRILKLVAKTEPGVSARAAGVGLGHSRTDVQESCVDLIEKLMPDLNLTDRASLQSELVGWIDTVAPQLRQRVAALVGVDTGGSQPEGEVDIGDAFDRLEAVDPKASEILGIEGRLAKLRLGEPTPALVFKPWEAPVVSDSTRIRPVESVDELVEVVTAALTGSVDGIDIERALDGMARFADAKLDRTAKSTIESHVKARVQRFGSLPSLGVVTPVLSWATGQRPAPLPFLQHKAGLLKKPQLRGYLVTPKPEYLGQEHADYWARMSAYDGTQIPANFEGMGLSRAWEVAARCAERKPQPLLSMPTHLGGWINPAILADRLERIAEVRGRPDRFDACQAILRLAPVEDERTSGRLRSLSSPVAAAALSVMGIGRAPDDEGLRRAARVAAVLGNPVVVNEPPEYKHHSPIVGVAFPTADDGVELRRDDPVGMSLTKLGKPRRDRYWWNAASAVIAQASPARMSWATLTAPRSPGVLGAAAAMGLASDLDSNRSSDAHHVALAALIDSDIPLDIGAHAGLAIALSARNDSSGTVAVDLVAEAGADGRLDPELLGSLLAQFSNGELTSLARSAARLQQIGPMSALHADQVRRVIIALLAELKTTPRDIHSMLGVLVSVGSTLRRGIANEAAAVKLAELHQVSPRSKRGKLARAALELPVSWAAGLPEALQAEVLLDRAERWSH